MKLKFRAWEPNYDGKMHYSNQEHASYKDESGKCSWHITTEGVHIELWDYSYGPNNSEMHKVIPEDQAVMQYTGIKDCNGQDIFEGDIIALKEESFDEDSEERVLSLHEVVWGGEQYPAWTLKPSIESECNVFSYLVCATEAPKFEVVGNIHEDLAEEL